MTDLSKLDEYFVDLIRIEGDLVIFNHWEAGENTSSSIGSDPRE